MYAYSMAGCEFNASTVKHIERLEFLILVIVKLFGLVATDEDAFPFRRFDLKARLKDPRINRSLFCLSVVYSAVNKEDRYQARVVVFAHNNLNRYLTIQWIQDIPAFAGDEQDGLATFVGITLVDADFSRCSGLRLFFAQERRAGSLVRLLNYGLLYGGLCIASPLGGNFQSVNVLLYHEGKADRRRQETLLGAGL